MWEYAPVRTKIPLYRQHPGSNDCVLVSARMILDSFGVKTTNDEVRSRLPLGRSNNGYYFYEIGTFFQRSGYSVVHIDLDQAFPRKVYGLTGQRGAQQLLNSAVQSFRPSRYLRAMKCFVKSGGMVETRPVTENDIRRMLQENARIMVGVKHRYLNRAKPNSTDRHAVVVTGISSQRVWINDPFTGRDSYPLPYFLYASWYGCGALVIRQKRKNG